MKEIEKLRSKVEALPYPEGVMKKVSGEIKGEGFFPGADGIMDKSSQISNKSIMIIGQDQDNEVNFQQSEVNGNEKHTRTWHNLIKLLEAGDIDLSDCFLTNCIMGVRVGNVSNTGISPAFNHPPFINACIDFLRYQIAIQKPKVILCLGRKPIEVIGKLVKSLAFKWDGFEKLDKEGRGINFDISIDGIANYKTTVIYLLHPSFRNSNLKYRHYKGFVQNEAEIQLLKSIHSNKVEHPLTKIIEQLGKATSIKELETNLNNPLLKKYKKDDTKYPALQFKISPSEIKVLQENGWLNHKNQLNTDRFEYANSLEKLLLSLIWKNGDLKKIAKIIDGIEGKTITDKEPIIFHHFGNYLKNPATEIIIDQHVIRAYRIIEIFLAKNGLSQSDLLTIIKKDTYKGTDSPLVTNYKNWIQHNKLINKAIPRDQQYLRCMDDLLFAIGRFLRKSEKS